MSLRLFQQIAQMTSGVFGGSIGVPRSRGRLCLKTSWLCVWRCLPWRSNTKREDQVDYQCPLSRSEPTRKLITLEDVMKFFTSFRSTSFKAVGCIAATPIAMSVGAHAGPNDPLQILYVFP